MEILNHRKKKYREEAAVLLGLNNNNIIRTYGVFFEKDQLNIFMELMAGGSVRDKLDEDGPFNSDQIRYYVYQILLGLEYLHNEGIIHRDLKCWS